MEAQDRAPVSTFSFGDGKLGLFVRGPAWGVEQGHADEVLVDQVRCFAGDTKITSLHMYRTNVGADAVRFLFDEFPNLEQVDLIDVHCAGEDLGVLASQILRGKKIKCFTMRRCNLGPAGTRDLLQFAESTQSMDFFLVSFIGRAWEREEALFAARLVETSRSTQFRFGDDAGAPMQAALNRAAERRYNVLVLLFLPPSAGTPLARFMRKDGDHAIALRVLAMLGGDVVFDDSTVEEAYDACVLRVGVV